MEIPISNLILKDIHFYNNSLHSSATYLSILTVVNLTLENLKFEHFVHSNEGQSAQILHIMKDGLSRLEMRNITCESTEMNFLRLDGLDFTNPVKISIENLTISNNFLERNVWLVLFWPYISHKIFPIEVINFVAINNTFTSLGNLLSI